MGLFDKIKKSVADTVSSALSGNTDEMFNKLTRQIDNITDTLESGNLSDLANLFGSTSKSASSQSSKSKTDKPDDVVTLDSALIKQLLGRHNPSDITVDEDGDVRADFSYANGESFEWFTWYIISGNTLDFDSGASDIPDSFDVEEFARIINTTSTVCEVLTAKIKDNGSLRLKISIKIGDSRLQHAKGLFNSAQELLENTWGNVAKIVAEECRRRPEPQEEYNDDDDEEEEEEETRSSSRSRSRGDNGARPSWNSIWQNSSSSSSSNSHSTGKSESQKRQIAMARDRVEKAKARLANAKRILAEKKSDPVRWKQYTRQSGYPGKSGKYNGYEIDVFRAQYELEKARADLARLK